MDRPVLGKVGDHYDFVDHIAEGGMGTIWLGKKLGVDGFEKQVVLKQLLPEYTRDPKFRAMFVQEARLCASLDHANIVRMFDLVADGENHFMVMEYIRGGDLRTLLKRARRGHKRFCAQAALFIGHELLEALAYAHGKTGPDGRPLQLVHRDVSPSNILLSGAGEVKLTDFGIAKASTQLSVVSKVKGKVGYMSPEQARGETLDARSDLFALGVVLYEVLVGERLFVGDLLSSASMIFAQKVTPPSQKRPELPREIDDVLLKALQLDPKKRFQSAQDFQEALGRVASRHRLLFSANEMASHLRQVCGDDPGGWLKLETLVLDQAASSQGTAVMPGFDPGEPSGSIAYDDSEPHPSRQPANINDFADKTFSSVIALRDDPGDNSLVTLPPLSYEESFDGEDSQAGDPTRVRDGSPRNELPPGPRRATTDERTLVREQSEPLTFEEPTVLSPRGPAPVLLSPGPVVVVTRPLYEESGESPQPGIERTLRGHSVLWVVLLLIGIAVALGVSFSGPALEVVDPASLQSPAR